MRLPDLLGVVAALVVGGLLVVLLLASAVAAPPALPTPVPPSIPPLPTPTQGPQRTLTPTAAPGTAGPSVAIGQPAPPLQVTLLDGSLLDTADYAGTPMWINFMATWCPQCIDELPLMERYQTDYDGFMNMFVIDTGESEDTVEAFMDELGVTIPVGVDEDGSAQASWGTYALPVHVFIDADGVVQDIVYGGAPLEVWDAAIQKIVPDFVPPSPAAN
jgi:cytochrome c biogenesis protein CcmG/thiol:disulfide interchange protein DsbE